MEDIIKISPDNKRAKALKEMALERYSTIRELKIPYRIIEEYYEIIKELLTAYMYKEGFKTLSHKSLVDFSKENIKFISNKDSELIDELRIKRNNIVYYGERITSEFLKSREPAIRNIIELLIKNLLFLL